MFRNSDSILSLKIWLGSQFYEVNKPKIKLNMQTEDSWGNLHFFTFRLKQLPVSHPDK